MPHSLSGISVRKYVAANEANSIRPAIVSAMAVATAMFRGRRGVLGVEARAPLPRGASARRRLWP